MKTNVETNAIILQFKDINLKGNVIDEGWIENLKYDNGKTNLNAIMILSEIVYWYRPTLKRNQETGDFLGYKKKFKADLLQKSYEDLGNRFGLTKQQAKDAFLFLENKGLVKKEFRTIDTPKGKMNNVMFIEPFYDKIKNITGINRVVEEYTVTTDEQDNNKKDDIPPLPSFNYIGDNNDTYPPYLVSTGEPMQFKPYTNTYTTTQTKKDKTLSDNSDVENNSILSSLEINQQISFIDNNSNKPPKTPRKKSEPNPHTKELIEYFKQKYIDKLRTQPIITYAADGAIFKSLLTKRTCEELKKIIDFYFESEDSFLKSSGYSISKITKCVIPKYDSEQKFGQPTPKVVNYNNNVPQTQNYPNRIDDGEYDDEYYESLYYKPKNNL